MQTLCFIFKKKVEKDIFIHVYAVPESAQEALAVVLEEPLQEGAAAITAGQLLYVNELDATVVLVERLPDYAAAHAIVGGQLLERRPAQVLLVVAVPLLRLRPPKRVLKIRLHLPEGLRDGGAQAQAPPARRGQCRRMLIMMIHIEHGEVNNRWSKSNTGRQQ